MDKFVDMFPYKAICWSEVKSDSFSRAELYRLLVNGERSELLNPLPVESITKELLHVFGKRNAEHFGDIVKWKYGGDVHQIEVTKYFFRYGHRTDPDSSGSIQASSWEICEIPAIAGRFGCIVYFNDHDSFMLRPVGSVIKIRTQLARRLGSDTDECNKAQCFQLPVAFSSKQESPMSQYCATINLEAQKLEARSGLTFEEDLDDLDQFKIALLEIGDYRYLLQCRQHRAQKINVMIQSSITSPEDARACLISALDLNEKELSFAR